MSVPPAIPRAVVGIQARTGSTRLPRKVLADLGGKPLLERVVERARAATRVERVVVLTSDTPGDDELARLCFERGIEVRRGSEADVLSRYLALVDATAPDYVVRVTGDCPFIEPGFIDRQLAALAAFDADFPHVAQAGIEGTLCGMGAMSARALRQASESTDPRDREHVGSFFFQRERARFRWVALDVDPAWRRPSVRLTVDEPDDLRLAQTLYERFAPEGRPATFSTLEVLAHLDRHSELCAWNAAALDSADNRAVRALRAAPDRPLVGTFPA